MLCAGTGVVGVQHNWAQKELMVDGSKDWRPYGHKKQSWGVSILENVHSSIGLCSCIYTYVYMGSWDVQDSQFGSLFCICQSHLLPIYMARSDLTDEIW